MRPHTFILLSLAAATLGTLVFAQAPASTPAGPTGTRTGRASGVRPPSAPTPRWPDGHPMLSAGPGKTGFWNSGTGGLTGKNGMNLPTNLEIGEVPFQPWAKALYEARRADQQKNDPHARCVRDKSTRRMGCSFTNSPRPNGCWCSRAAARERGA